MPRMTKSRVIRKKTSYATKAYVKSQVNRQIDWGHIDTQVDTAGLLFNAVPVHLNDINTGSNFDQREGLEIINRSLQYRVQIQPNVGSPIDAHCRMIIFKWDDPVDPVVGSVLSDTGTLRAPIGLYNKTTTNKLYRILASRTFPVNIAGQDHVMINGSLKLNFKSYYTGTTGSNSTKGSIWVQFLSDASATGPKLDSNFRVQFEK